MFIAQKNVLPPQQTIVARLRCAGAIAEAIVPSPPGSLRDNDSNREDADSNKTMSFLQMIFLPATFVAAIVSMNFFDLTTSPPKVSSYIWVFWVVALALTALVMAVYFFWKWKTREK